MKFKIVNSIPRIVFFYKSISTNGQLAWKEFVLPSRPDTFLRAVMDFHLVDKDVCKDELGILFSHDDIYKKDDIILAVGVGSGISLIHNCAKERISNSFIGIDGSNEQIEIAKANARLNGIDFSKFELIAGYAGKPTNIYGNQNQQSTNFIDINKMKFDVLELDCEGSEIEILRDLSVRPRHIIVEMHPSARDINISIFLLEMKSKCYKLEKIYTVNGELVFRKHMDVYFRNEHIEKMVNQDIKWGDGLLVLNFTLI